MDIALFGYGRMGKLIGELAPERKHNIARIIDENDSPDAVAGCDVAIDFSVPAAALNNIKTCIDHGVPVVSGTTGWHTGLDEAKLYCDEKGGAFLYASNFSIGMNIFFGLNKTLGRFMNKVDGYQLSMEETHHIHKKDAPSGTAISLAEDIVDLGKYKGWSLDEKEANHIPIKSFREGEVPGIHKVKYTGEIDEITISHEAFNRKGFAIGALVAAEWIVGKKGVFTMEDVLELKK